MVQQELPPENDTIGLEYLAILVPIFFLAIFAYSVRIYTRLAPKVRLTLADYAISVAVAAEAFVISLTAAAVARGFGRHNYYLTIEDIEAIGQCTFGVFLAGWVASCLARISAACLLLQFTTPRPWRAVLWVTVGFQVALLVASEIFEFVQCRPIRAIWEPVPDAVCLAPEQMWLAAYTTIAIAMISDAIFAILPMFFIWTLRRPFVEIFLISFLLAMGLFAVGAVAVKIHFLKAYDVTSPDTLRQMMPLFLWSRIEEIVLIIAACAPLLKSPIERVLKRIWLSTWIMPPRELDPGHSTMTQNSTAGHSIMGSERGG